MQVEGFLLLHSQELHFSINQLNNQFENYQSSLDLYIELKIKIRFNQRAFRAS